ncbi:hypothetical protein HYY74_04905 [Candidatus Woesearchaeota archaeon]|nr:hypothetical protein [Candidatus Woesearchaeota archaeon]
MQTVPAKLTDRLIIEAEELIKEGGYAHKSELIRDALTSLFCTSRLIEHAVSETTKYKKI